MIQAAVFQTDDVRAVPSGPQDGDGTKGSTSKSRPVYGKRKTVASKNKQADKPPPPPPPAATSPSPETSSVDVPEAAEEVGSGELEGTSPGQARGEYGTGAADGVQEEDAGIAGAADDWEDAVDEWDEADVSVRLCAWSLMRRSPCRAFVCRFFWRRSTTREARSPRNLPPERHRFRVRSLHIRSLACWF